MATAKLWKFKMYGITIKKSLEKERKVYYSRRE
jgi:hypothetical protein